MIFSPTTLALRAKTSWNLHCRKTHRFHLRVCMSATFCAGWMVYDGSCYRHQDVYDRSAARRLKRARRNIAKRHRQVWGKKPSGRF